MQKGGRKRGCAEGEGNPMGTRGRESRARPAGVSGAWRGGVTLTLGMTIFAKILSGQIPCHKVYEDAHVLAFLDINPLSPGHTLVIPKEAKATVGELSDDSAAAIGRVLPRLCRAIGRAVGATDYNILQNNGAGAHQVVMHVHFHIIPKMADGRGLGIRWEAGKLGAEEAAGLVKAIGAGW